MLKYLINIYAYSILISQINIPQPRNKFCNSKEITFEIIFTFSSMLCPNIYFLISGSLIYKFCFARQVLVASCSSKKWFCKSIRMFFVASKFRLASVKRNYIDIITDWRRSTAALARGRKVDSCSLFASFNPPAHNSVATWCCLLICYKIWGVKGNFIVGCFVMTTREHQVNLVLPTFMLIALVKTNVRMSFKNKLVIYWLTGSV